MLLNPIARYLVRYSILVLFIVLAGAGCSTVRIQLNTLSIDATYLYAPVRINGFSTQFLVDTGATHTVLSAQFASELGLMDDARQFDGYIRTAGSPISEAWFVTVESFELDGTRYQGATDMLVVDLSTMSEALGVRVDGVLGMNALVSTRFTLDPRNKVLTLRQNSECEGLSHSLRQVNGNLFIPVIANGTQFDFLLDTGALVTVVNGKDFADHDITFSTQAEERLAADLGTNLRKVTYTYAQLDLAIGDLAFQDHTVRIGDKNSLGLDILGRGVLTVSSLGLCFQFEH